MATVSINHAATTSQVTPHQQNQNVSDATNAFQALLNLADIPDPGGGPPSPSAEAGASNPGPNARSNQPDLLPLPELAKPTQAVTTGIASELPQPTAVTSVVPTFPDALVGSGPPGRIEDPAEGALRLGLPAKRAKADTTNPLQAALVGVVTAAIAQTGAGIAEPSGPSPTVAAATVGVVTESAPTTQPAPDANVQPSGQSEELLQVVVDSPSTNRGAPAAPGIKNATVSSATAINVPDSEVAITATGDGAPEGFGENQSGGHTPNHEPAAPNFGEVGVSASTPAASTPIHTAPLSAVQTLSDPQRLDVVRQLADRIELMAAARPQQGVTIHLQPHGLGDVTIVVKGVGKDIEASFSATNVAVRNALSEGRDVLTQAVTAKGYNLVGVNVAAHAQSMSGRDRQQPSNQQPSSQAFGQPPGGGAPNGNNNLRGGASAAATTSSGSENDAEPRVLAEDGVDYRI